MPTSLVLGASGFLGSHLVKQLAEGGHKVQIFTRQSSNTSTIDHLELERFVGDIHDQQSLEQAMEGCDTVYHTIVDTRTWLRDASPLYSTNVDGTRCILEAALAVGVPRLVYISSVTTIGLTSSGIASEESEFNWWHRSPPYVKTRVQAERLVLDYVVRGLDAVICNVGTTYGEADAQPTPHGELALRLATGNMPAYWDAQLCLVGVKDAARGLILAADKGRSGERYLLTDRLLTMQEFCNKIADLSEQPRPRFYIPTWLMYLVCFLSQTLMHALGKDTEITIKSLQLSRWMSDFNNNKAREELGWQPHPIEESFKEATDWFRNNSTRN